MAVHFIWEFKENTRNGRGKWYREFPRYKTVEAALEQYVGVVDTCTNCKGHRLVRVEKQGTKTISTRLFFTLNSRPAEYSNANS